MKRYPSRDPRHAWGQYFTPVWAAEALVERYFTDLTSADAILEPSCGLGAFLQAIPPAIPALGVELDPALADEARRRTGRPVLTGDFRTIALTLHPTVIVGNPPFQLKVIDQFLQRAHTLLPQGGRLGFIVPAYMFQTAERVMTYAQSWSLQQDALPRNLFPGLSHPLAFALFHKDRRRTLVGFALYPDTASIQQLPPPLRHLLHHGPDGSIHQSIWRHVIEESLTQLGGEAALTDIYAVVAPRRPTATQFWREKIRQSLQRYARRTGPGRYALATAA